MVRLFCCVVSAVAVLTFCAAAAPVPDTPFAQEYREFYAVEGDAGANDIRGIAIDGAGGVWTAAETGIYRFAQGRWKAMLPAEEAGPSFAAVTDGGGQVWLGAWNGLYVGKADGSIEKIPAVDQPIGAIAATRKGIVAMGPYGMWRQSGGAWTHARGAWANSPRAIAEARDGTLWVATGHGLYHLDGTEVIGHIRDEDEIQCGDMYGAAIDSEGALWTGSFGAIERFRDGKRDLTLTPREGLPSSEVRRIAFDPVGRLWVCTGGGVARYDGRGWSLRHSLRWLPSDDSRAVAFGADGAAWVATAAGVSVIRSRPMTLEEKAAHFEDIVLKRKARPPWLVERSRLLTPGDVSTSTYEDDDNDGQYTNMYMVMEIMRHKVTGDAQAAQNARKAFDAMEFLQTVTGTDGFIARTVIPREWIDDPNYVNPHVPHDANHGHSPREIAEWHVSDPRYKPVDERWRVSADGQWYWKGDTSSDEVTGHYFGYYFYYKYMADTDAEKERVRALVRRVTDHIIDGGYTFRDIDGKATRWGVWAPEKLFGDADWQSERPVNCVELLSYLKTAYYITGGERYQAHYRHLIEAHGYAEVARKPKPTAPSEKTHIDSELLALTLIPLIEIEEEPGLLEKYREGLNQWFAEVKDEYSPLFSFICGALGVEDIGADKCVEFLRDHPLDLIEWTVDNSAREDVKLVRWPEIDPLQTDRLLPASERGIIRWDRNPWAAVQGAGGHVEASGVAWLAPYWLGRFYGFIAAPQ